MSGGIHLDDCCVCRQLKLSETPHSLCFCSERGDLLVGIGKHIHRIEYKNCKCKRIHGIEYKNCEFLLAFD